MEPAGPFSHCAATTPDVRPALAYISTLAWITLMKTVLTVLVACAMLATLGVLFAGLIGMAHSNDPARSNRLMRWRVILQASTLVLVAILMLLIKS